jgi:hypothetical protein
VTKIRRRARCAGLSLAWLAWLGAGSSGCATHAADVAPAPTSSAEFMPWDCGHIDDELDRVQQHAADVAYSVDQRAGENIVALGVGLAVFWPALLAMRPAGLDATELARLKGRFEALEQAERDKGCPPAADTLSHARAAALPIRLDERLVYEDRRRPGGLGSERVLRLVAIHRGELDYRLVAPPGGALPPGADAGPALPANAEWRQDLAGNLIASPSGALQWPHLLHAELELGEIVSGDIVVAGDGFARARMRGQVVALGPQTVDGRQFQAAVVELFGDAPSDNASTRVEGAIVVDRFTGVLLRLDLDSSDRRFWLQRRLVRIDAALP